jgi:ATP-dependent protease ClpP protease subunit
VDWFTSRSPKDAPAFQVLSKGVGCYDGQIDGRLTRQIVAWLSSTEVPPLLVIRSSGGPVDEALPIGRIVLQTRATVAVSGLCASSCANYIFGVARKRLLLPNSIVLFHGGVSPATIEEAASQVREQLRLLKVSPDKIEANVDRVRHKLGVQFAEQRALLKQAGVDPGFLERFDDVDLSEIDTSNCTPGTDRVAIFLSRKQFRRIGMQVSGAVPHSATEATTILNTLGKAERSVCLAPASLVGGS